MATSGIHRRWVVRRCGQLGTARRVRSVVGASERWFPARARAVLHRRGVAKAKVYVVLVGREPGVYRDWESCRAQVHGYPGAEFQGYGSLVEAERAWFQAGGDPVPLDDDDDDGDELVMVAPEPRGRGEGPVVGAIAVDAACSGNPGPMEYRGVEIATGHELFRVGPMKGTNNLGEFLAIVHGMAWMQARERRDPIYSDSMTAIGWVRRGRVRSTLARTAATAEVWALVERAQRWLHLDARPVVELLKWPTKRWGEIPADFGRK